MKQNGDALRHAFSLWSDKEVVLEAVKKTGYMLVFASTALRKDKEVVLAAVKKTGHALQYASAALRADKEVVLEAVKQDVYALQYASVELQSAPHMQLLAATREDEIEAIVRASREEALGVQEEVANALIFKSTQLPALEPLAAEVAAALYAPNGPIGKRDRAAFEVDFGEAQ